MSSSRNFEITAPGIVFAVPGVFLLSITVQRTTDYADDTDLQLITAASRRYIWDFADATAY